MKEIILGGKHPPKPYFDFVLQLYGRLNDKSHGNLLFITDIYMSRDLRMSSDLVLFKELGVLSPEMDSISLVFEEENGAVVYSWNLKELFRLVQEGNKTIHDVAEMMLNRENYEMTLELPGYHINARGCLTYPYEKAKKYLHVEIKDKKYFEREGSCLLKEVNGLKIALQLAWKLDRNLLMKQGVFDDLLQYWGKDKEELFAEAIRNTQERFPAMIYTSGENYVKCQSPMYLSQFSKYDSKRPVVADASDMTYSAILLYYDNVLQKMAEHWRNGFVASIVDYRAVVFASADAKASLLNRMAHCVSRRFSIQKTQMQTFRCTKGDLSLVPCKMQRCG